MGGCGLPEHCVVADSLRRPRECILHWHVLLRCSIIIATPAAPTVSSAALVVQPRPYPYPLLHATTPLNYHLNIIVHQF